MEEPEVDSFESCRSSSSLGSRCGASTNRSAKNSSQGLAGSGDTAVKSQAVAEAENSAGKTAGLTHGETCSVLTDTLKSSKAKSCGTLLEGSKLEAGVDGEDDGDEKSKDRRLDSSYGTKAREPNGELGKHASKDRAGEATSDEDAHEGEDANDGTGEDDLQDDAEEVREDVELEPRLYVLGSRGARYVGVWPWTSKVWLVRAAGSTQR